MKQSNTEQPRQAASQAARERWECVKRDAPIYWKAFREWSRIHGRRVAHQIHNVVAGNRAAGPVSFLVCSAALAVALTLTTLYAPSYAVTLDGEPVGVVTDEGMVQKAIQSVEETGSQLLGYDYRVEGDLEYEFALSLRSELTTPEELQNYFYHQLDAVSGELRKYQVLVDGQAVGVVKDENSLNQLLDGMKDRYTTENTVSVRFLDTVATEPVYEVNDLMTIREMEQAFQASGNGSTTYTVVAGDTFNAIAYANDMSVSDLKALNPSVDINRLMVGDVLNVKELTPLLSVETVDDVTYVESIPCPVEEIKDSPLDSDFDNTARALTLIPGVFLKFTVWLLRTMDYFGLLPGFLLEVSPFHGSVFFTSMGSLGIPAIYHHLYDFGNLPVFGAFGCKRRTNEVLADGTVVQRKYVDLKFCLDERIVDGFYYATVFKYMKRLMQHPDLLDQPPEEVVQDID